MKDFIIDGYAKFTATMEGINREDAFNMLLYFLDDLKEKHNIAIEIERMDIHEKQ